ncbi:putative membrane protein [Micavibrio aeruginosavorus ARL-13]|uniref:Putative membrane protein n=1 Tax=Micavibrio aeruginosavorus (strain ARL-13) TaxID=856793 RepID=G2KM47_MICAA|nr:putative membrane protein [Micavibrio aeruginosavorus ARL-13]
MATAITTVIMTAMTATIAIVVIAGASASVAVSHKVPASFLTR